MNLYQDQFSSQHDYPVYTGNKHKTLIIASTGRCGSHMLGHALHKTHCFGFPLEYANPSNLREWQRLIGSTDLTTVMQGIVARRTAENGVFGIKIHYAHLRTFGGFQQALSFFPNPYIVLLSRTNVLDQAVSLSLAKQTGVWIAGQQPVRDNPEYNFAHINHCLRQTILNNASWRYTLAASGKPYIEMNFDQVKNNLAESIQQIADFIGVELAVDATPAEQATKKQSSGINQQWKQRFIADFDCSSELLPELNMSRSEKIKRRLKLLFRL